MGVDDTYRLTATLMVDCAPTTKAPGQDPPPARGTRALITLDLEVQVDDPRDLAAAVTRVMSRIHVNVGDMLVRRSGLPAAPVTPARARMAALRAARDRGEFEPCNRFGDQQGCDCQSCELARLEQQYGRG